MIEYEQFLKSKVKLAQQQGFQCQSTDFNPILKPHQKMIAAWMVTGGRRACFASFGLGKSVIQLEVVRMILQQIHGRGLIVVPLGVRQEFRRDATELLSWPEPPKFIRSIGEAGEIGIYMTNYETIRDGKLDPCHFVVASLDEAACFAPGTMVETSQGLIAIEKIKVGNMVANVSGYDNIRAIHKNEIKSAVRIKISGKEITSSPDHRFFTSRGWVNAGSLRPGDSIVETRAAMRILRSNLSASHYSGSETAFLQFVLRSEMEDDYRDEGENFSNQKGARGFQNADKSESKVATAEEMRMVRAHFLSHFQQRIGKPILRESVLCEMANVEALSEGHNCESLPHVGGQGEARKGNCKMVGIEHKESAGSEEAMEQARAHCGSYRENAQEIARQNVPCSRWKQQNNRAAEIAIESVREFADGICNRNGIGQESIQITSQLLQSGFSRCGKENRNRSRWQQPQEQAMAFSGPSENRCAGFARVDSVEILESGNPKLDKYREADGKCYFYDLSATRHPSYTVNGLLVHNCLRGFGSTKTFREFMRLFTGDAGPAATMRGVVDRAQSVKYRFVATATPSPNEYIELLAYAEFLGIMDVSQAKTRFFKRDSTKADKLTLHAHTERAFWLWVSSWALFVQRPEDLGCEGAEYVLPKMNVHWHEVKTDHKNAGFEKNGQAKLIRDSAIGVQDAASEKRSSLSRRVVKLREIVQANKMLTGEQSDQLVIWSDLNDEQKGCEAALAEDGISFASVYGHMDPDEKEVLLAKWIGREAIAFLSKPVMHGAGVNLQQCHTMVYLGIGFKFYAFLQAMHRIVRFLQKHDCEIHIIYSEAERTIRQQLERKWKQHNHMVEKMTEIIKEFGLCETAMAEVLTRKMGVERIEVIGEGYRLINNDSVKECAKMEANSIQLILTSIPFSTQYEYSPNFADFGHSGGNEEFFGQMDYLTPELLRVLESGRLCAIHVKDRIVPGGMTGLGFQTVYPFHSRTIEHFIKHGFAYMGMKTIVTDVVRENNQTYRLGWTEQCKDGSKMGVGMPEYLLIFRKPPTENQNSYADNPVRKSKTDYSRSRWQIDAHGFSRSGGNRLLTPEEISTLPHADIFKIFKVFSLNEVYNFEHHVKIGEAIDAKGRLPVTFMLLQPQSWHDDVWTDITRMLTLNGAQSAKGKEMHLCPMQFDLADRAITQWSNPGETVLDPFGGLMTVPYRAIRLRRKAIGIDLSFSYMMDGAAYCKAAADEIMMPSLFDLDAEEIIGKREDVPFPIEVEKPKAKSRRKAKVVL